MKKINVINLYTILTLTIIISLTQACHFRSIKGNGNVSSEMRDVADFTEVEVSSALTVVYSHGPEYKVEVIADDNLIKYITTEVRGTELQIGVKKGKSFRKPTKTEIHVTSPTIKSISLSGASVFWSTDSLTCSDLNLHLSGASLLKILGVFNYIKSDLSGASSAEISGHAENVNFEASGASNYKTYGLETGNATIIFSGASSGTLSIQNNLVAVLSGASTLNYYGNPSVSSNLSGSSSINKK